MRLLTSQIADAVGGTLVGEDVWVDAFTQDSREAGAGSFFVPVLDVRDGHDFIRAALDAGAVGYFTARDPLGGTAVGVEDPVRALSALAAWGRDRLAAGLGERVVGITGSVGKTSTKDMVAAVLSRAHRTSANLRSFNNELGVPLTILNSPDDTEALVVEMGMRGFGHITDLCEIARPTIGVVTAIELVHTEAVNDLAGVARAKGELVEALPAGGAAVLNADDERVASLSGLSAAPVLTFGRRGEVRAEGVELDDELRSSFTLRTPWGAQRVRLAARGEHQVANALAAAAVGLLSDVTIEEVAAGLEEANLSPMRMDLRRTPTGAIVLNDAYNAGPASVRAALRSLARLEADRHVAVLGPMMELGSTSTSAHREVGELAESLGVRVVGVGAPDYGAEDVEDIEAARAALGHIGSGDAVLVKASRAAALERLVDKLLDEPPAG